MLILPHHQFTQFSFPGRERCKLLGPFIQGLGTQIPTQPSPSLVLYNDGEHLYQELNHPWPGQEKVFDWLPYREYTGVRNCPNATRYPEIGIITKGHDFGRRAQVQIFRGLLRSYEVAIPPLHAMHLIQFPFTDAFFVRWIGRTHRQARVAI
jgi:hypothetical protein